MYWLTTSPELDGVEVWSCARSLDCTFSRRD
jgi:hypothetical protein